MNNINKYYIIGIGSLLIITVTLFQTNKNLIYQKSKHIYEDIYCLLYYFPLLMPHIDRTIYNINSFLFNSLFIKADREKIRAFAALKS